MAGFLILFWALSPFPNPGFSFFLSVPSLFLFVSIPIIHDGGGEKNCWGQLGYRRRCVWKVMGWEWVHGSFGMFHVGRFPGLHGGSQFTVSRVAAWQPGGFSFLFVFFFWSGTLDTHSLSH